ncbi:MAG TPA: DUF2065 domain-containing protein [Burkholderiales bacterium]|nr:DUF2065 domain-containing protein [Burkholderiales bacterium]
MGPALLMAMALMLVIEGILPFLAPSAWRETFRRIIALSDSQLRCMGLSATMAGLALLYLAH